MFRAAWASRSLSAAAAAAAIALVAASRAISAACCARASGPVGFMGAPGSSSGDVGGTAGVGLVSVRDNEDTHPLEGCCVKLELSVIITERTCLLHRSCLLIFEYRPLFPYSLTVTSGQNSLPIPIGQFLSSQRRLSTGMVVPGSHVVIRIGHLFRRTVETVIV